jgi:hypothetical protein
MSKPYYGQNLLSPASGFAGAVAQGPQGGNNLRFTPGAGPQSNASYNIPGMGGGNTPRPIKYQGIHPSTGPEFGYGVGAAGFNGQQLPRSPIPGQSSSSTVGSLSYGMGEDAMGAYQSAFNSAKAANEARYGQGLGELGGLYDRSMKYLEGQGDTERAEISKRGEQAKAGNRQRLTDLGLSGTTIGQTLDQGVDRQTTEAQGGLNERLNAQRLGTDANLTQNKVGFIERREDPYPDMGAYAQLASSLSSSSSSTGGTNYANPNGVQVQGFGGGGLGMDFQPGPGGRGGQYVPRQAQNLPFNGTPTGVNLDYITPAALNDASYMDAFRNTPITRPPRLVNQRQYSS